MNTQFQQAHTLGQEQAAQQLSQVIQQIMENLARVFREGQYWHDQAERIQQENASPRAMLTAREQQERLDRIELEVRLAGIAATAEKKPESWQRRRSL